MKISEVIQKSRKIVIKIGSNTLAKEDGTQNTEFMQNFARQCSNLIKQGKQIVLVSSGAQVAGVSTTKEWARKKDVHYRQALCSIGQVELMHQWRKAFAMENLHIGQLLLTKDDFENEHRQMLPSQMLRRNTQFKDCKAYHLLRAHIERLLSRTGGKQNSTKQIP